MVTHPMRRACLLGALMALYAVPAGGQIVRPPELKLQYHRAERAWKSGTSLQEARARLDRVLAELPDDTEARVLRARVLLDLREPAAALADARVAVTLEPKNGEAHLIRCEAARLAGYPDEAAAALDEAARRITSGAPAHVRLSHNAQALGQMDRAEAFARVAVASDEQLPGSYRQLARVFLAQERPDDAVTLLVLGLERGVLTPGDVRSDEKLAPLVSRPRLAPWFR